LLLLKIGHFCPFRFAFTKIKQKNETTNKCRENLRINNLNLRFHICKSKGAKSGQHTLALQTRIYGNKS